MAPFDAEGFAPPVVEGPVTDDVLRVLIEARALIGDAQCWAKEDGGDTHRRCTLNAIRDASISLRIEGTPVKEIARDKYLKGALPSHWTRSPFVHVYNDDPSTTHADILALFDRAITARRAEIGG